MKHMDEWKVAAMQNELIREVQAARRLPSPAAARAIRLAAEVGQTRMAQELGVNRVTVYRWECGSRRPRGLLLARYLDILEALRREALR